MIRTLLTIAVLVAFALAVAGLGLGWRRRARRQSDLGPLPLVPAECDEPLAALSGLYVGTTYATSWQDRVVHAGLGRRADCGLSLHRQGVLIERRGDDPVFIPSADIVGARLEPGLAGKVMGAGGVLVVRWRLSETELDTGVRGDDKSQYPEVVNAVNELSRSTL